VRDEESKNGELEDSLKKPPKPTLQKLTTTDNVEHFLATFERITLQQKWSKEVRMGDQVYSVEKQWQHMQPLTSEDSVDYDKVKEAILRRYEINKEIYRQRFRQD